MQKESKKSNTKSNSHLIPGKAVFKFNWFYDVECPKFWTPHLKRFNGKFRYLEVGSFEGMSAHWIMTNYPDAKLTCLDTFEGSEEHENLNLDLEGIFRHNLSPGIKSGSVKIKKGISQEVLRTLKMDYYDVIYIDGDHRAVGVLEDAVLSFRLLKKGGVMIFDDYEWIAPSKEEKDRPKMGIASFLALYKGKYKLLSLGYQVIIEKI